MKHNLEYILWVILSIATGVGVMILGFVVVLGILAIIQGIIG